MTLVSAGIDTRVYARIRPNLCHLFNSLLLENAPEFSAFQQVVVRGVVQGRSWQSHVSIDGDCRRDAVPIKRALDSDT